MFIPLSQNSYTFELEKPKELEQEKMFKDIKKRVRELPIRTTIQGNERKGTITQFTGMSGGGVSYDYEICEKKIKVTVKRANLIPLVGFGERLFINRDKEFISRIFLDTVTAQESSL